MSCELIAFTPLYDVVARQIIGTPESIIEPGRIGMRLVTPWAWAIAFRRFNHRIEFTTFLCYTGIVTHNHPMTPNQPRA